MRTWKPSTVPNSTRSSAGGARAEAALQQRHLRLVRRQHRHRAQLRAVRAGQACGARTSMSKPVILLLQNEQAFCKKYRHRAQLHAMAAGQAYDARTNMANACCCTLSKLFAGSTATERSSAPCAPARPAVRCTNMSKVWASSSTESKPSCALAVVSVDQHKQQPAKVAARADALLLPAPCQGHNILADAQRADIT